MWRELGVLFKHLSSSPSVGAIVLSGASPKAFTTGIDVSEFASSPLLNPLNSASSSTPDPSRTSHQIREHVTAFQASISAVAECAKPVVAAVHGHCLGLGVDLICCADVRVASSDAVFAVKEVDIGIAADIGTLTRLPKIVRGGSWVMDVCLSGRTFRAEEAKDVGFVSRVVKINGNGNGSEDVVRDVLRWAEDVAQKSPVAVAGTKEILKWSWDRSVADGNVPPSPSLFPLPPRLSSSLATQAD